MPTFTETQRFRQWWLWLVVGVSVVVTIGSLWVDHDWQEPLAGLVLVPLLLVVLLLYYWRLDTRLDPDGIHYRVFPLFSWRIILWDTIQSVTVDSYAFVGYGIRLGFDGWIYNVSGNKGLRIIRKNKVKLTIGTQRPDEMRAFLTAHYASSGRSI